MNPRSFMFPGILLFTLSLLSALFSQFYPEIHILTRITFLCSIVYLLTGWFNFRRYFPSGNIFILFLVGFFYSSVLMAAVFCAASWPLSNVFAYLSLFWAAAALLLAFVQKKLMNREVFTQFLIEGLMLAALAIILVMKN
ncbi:MAG TPA: hypothetical protein VHO46_14620 [Bacteroidales bacterium]|nr:hypothetical protein [Bacteroidales bacterium]